MGAFPRAAPTRLNDPHLSKGETGGRALTSGCAQETWRHYAWQGLTFLHWKSPSRILRGNSGEAFWLASEPCSAFNHVLRRIQNGWANWRKASAEKAAISRLALSTVGKVIFLPDELFGENEGGQCSALLSPS